MKTSTKPQHATMLTGVWADEHGVFRNRCYQLIPDNLTVYERIESNDKSIKTAHISSKPKNFGKPTFGNIIKDVDYFVAKDISPKAATNRAMRLIHAWKGRDFFIVCHFKKPDSTGHAHGVDSKEYRKAILNCDSQLGRILDLLAQDAILDETKIYVLADHGFGAPKPTSHGDSPNTFIISNDGGMTDISMDQVAGFLLANFGLEP
jgi:predicted AlkP superfamily pyrophosphatase or phosphodiesterase